MIGSNNITTTAVKNELGENITSVNQLCASPRINMWSKYKPFDSPKITLDEVERIRANYGISIPTINNLANAAAYNWSYQRPRGGSGSPYRLGDFRNYSQNASETIRSGITDGDTISIDYGNTEHRINFALYNINGINGGTGLSDLQYGSIRFSNMRLGFVGKDKFNNWFYAIAPTSDSYYIPINANTIESKYPINGTLCLLTSDFQPPAYSSDTIPTRGSAFPIYHNSNAGYGNSIRIVVKDKPTFSFILSAISSSLRGTYENWTNFIGSGSSTFTSYFGNMYFKFVNRGAAAQIAVNDIEFYSSSNFHSNAPFSATGATGAFKVYNSSFTQITPGNVLNLAVDSVFYIGGGYLLNLGFSDVPLYQNIQSTFKFSKGDAGNSYGSFNLKGY